MSTQVAKTNRSTMGVEGKPHSNQVITTGIVKETPGQRKKHVEMMKAEEITYLVSRVRKFSSCWSISDHLLDKLVNERIIHPVHIESLLTEGLEENIVEYNEKSSGRMKSRRVLLRSTFAVPTLLEIKGVRTWMFANLCIVLNIDDGSVVTGYWNRVSDNHGTINLDRYTPSLRIS